MEIEDGLDQTTIRKQASDLLYARLSALPVEGHNIEPWPSGRAVACEEIVGLLAGVPGVVSVSSCRLARDDQPFDVGPLELDDDEIAIGRDHEIKVVR